MALVLDYSSAKLLLIAPIITLVLAIPAFTGLYVYRDAKRRGMNAVAWTLIAILAPLLVGFIIYLLVRSGYSDLECPQCGTRVAEQYVVCPQCGAKLRHVCPSCAAPTEQDWKVCPHCAVPLDGTGAEVTPPVRHRDTALGKVLVLVIVIPVVLVVIAIASYYIQPQVGSGDLQAVSFDDYLYLQQSEAVREEVRGWLNEVERANQAYILQYECFNELTAENDFYLLIYVPGAGQDSVSFGIASGLFNPTLELTMLRTGEEDTLFCARLRAEGMHIFGYHFILDGKPIGAEVRRVEYNPTLYFIPPDYSEVEPREDVALPERLSVVKYVDNHSSAEDIVEVTDECMMLDILAAIDSAERLSSEEGALDFDFRDGYVIVVEYQVREDLVFHRDMVRHLVFMEDGACYLQDARIRSSRYGSFFRQMDRDFYGLLEGMFEEG